MSDTWIESHSALRRHPKVGKLARALGIPRQHAIGILHSFWWWALEYAEDGELADTDPDDIAEACEWTDGNALLTALRLAGFVDDLTIHDWWDYTGRLLATRAERRAKTRERVTRYRQRRNALQRPCNGVSNAPVTLLPYRTVPNSTKDSLASLESSLIELDVDTTTDASANKAKPKPKARAVFSKPTEDECKSYADEIGMPPKELPKFYDYYCGNGWRVGKNPMKDWKATMRRWKRNAEEYSGDNGHKPQEITETPLPKRNTEHATRRDD